MVIPRVQLSARVGKFRLLANKLVVRLQILELQTEDRNYFRNLKATDASTGWSLKD